MFVDSIVRMLDISTITTDDVVQASVLAAQIYAERYNAPAMIVFEEKL